MGASVNHLENGSDCEVGWALGLNRRGHGGSIG